MFESTREAAGVERFDLSLKAVDHEPVFTTDFRTYFQRYRVVTVTV